MIVLYCVTSIQQARVQTHTWACHPPPHDSCGFWSVGGGALSYHYLISSYPGYISSNSLLTQYAVNAVNEEMHGEK